MLFTGIIQSVHAQDVEEFEYSRFFQAKTLVKEALEEVTKQAAGFQKDKNLQIAVVGSLTALLMNIKKNYGIDFAIISNEKNNTKVLLQKDILFVTIKLKYQDKKGFINWELTSVILPNEIDFYSVVDDNKEVTQDDVYAYKRLYKQ